MAERRGAAAQMLINQRNYRGHRCCCRRRRHCRRRGPHCRRYDPLSPPSPSQAPPTPPPPLPSPAPPPPPPPATPLPLLLRPLPLPSPLTLKTPSALPANAVRGGSPVAGVPQSGGRQTWVGRRWPRTPNSASVRGKKHLIPHSSHPRRAVHRVSLHKRRDPRGGPMRRGGRWSKMHGPFPLGPPEAPQRQWDERGGDLPTSDTTHDHNVVEIFRFENCQRQSF